MFAAKIDRSFKSPHRSNTSMLLDDAGLFVPTTLSALFVPFVLLPGKCLKQLLSCSICSRTTPGPPRKQLLYSSGRTTVGAPRKDLLHHSFALCAQRKQLLHVLICSFTLHRLPWILCSTVHGVNCCGAFCVNCFGTLSRRWSLCTTVLDIRHKK